jgi:hypothetical protein
MILALPGGAVRWQLECLISHLGDLRHQQRFLRGLCFGA